ncbi:Protein-export membrane protein SecF (TC 3.A.5.1.1) [hydrothermal vent metagenome]|uniref:Protein translocase subunit SecF n=1 Tax=hydrothermal vent metagenome TaxID=652676 RepID=A0A1W1ELB9_9ZZZZ
MEIFKYSKSVGFMGNSKKFALLSSILIIISLGLFITKGFNFGIDFAGGTLIQVKYKNDAPISKVRDILSKSEDFNGASVTYFGSNKEIIIKIKTVSSAVGDDVGDRINKVIASTGDFEIRRVDMVGPKVGNELKEKGLMAMFLAILGILIYISFRFEWRFAVASVLALLHDITIVIGAIVLFRVEVNLDILAAMLTILGYSLNDTIIVFDRIREGINTIKSPNLSDVIDESVTKTLSRTTLTSLTTFLVVFVLYIFGGEIIHGFSFTLLVGVIIGTYSSIFVASPILIWLKFSISEYRAKKVEIEKREKEKDRLRAQYEQGII